MAEPLGVRNCDDIEFQRREWIFQRAGWLFLGAFIVAAFSGLMGAGPLSATTSQASDDSVEVEYQRFIRHIGTTTMTISVGPAAVSDGKTTLYISRDLAAGWRIDSVSPTPSTESSSDEWLIYEFDVLGETPPEVELVYRGDGIGRNDGVIRAGDGLPVDVWQWIYP